MPSVLLRKFSGIFALFDGALSSRSAGVRASFEGIGLAFTVMVVMALPALSQESQDRLTEIQREVETVEQALSDVGEREGERRLKLKLVEKQSGEIKKDLVSLTRTLAEAKLARSEAEAEQIRAEENRRRSLEKARARLRALSVLQGGTTPAIDLILLGAKSSTPLPDLPWYVQRIRASDLALFRTLKEAYDRSVSAQNKAQSAVTRHEAQLKALQVKEASLALTAKEHKGILIELAEEKKEKEDLLANLRAQALRLETVVSSISGGEKEEAPSRSSEKRKSREQVEAYPGKGLHAERGRLTWPVKGTIVERFGKAKVQGFSDYVYRKGVGFRAAKGEEVTAVADGRVIFAGRLPGYGTVIILDHGKRYYSLYGLLRETDVDVGDDVSRGDEIGTVSDPAGEPNMHFEIRQNGDPIDPVTYLNRGRSKS